jgi:hypothetical protein
MEQFMSQWSHARAAAVFALALIVPITAFGQVVTVDNDDAEFTILSGFARTGAYGTPNGSDYNWDETSATGAPFAECEWRPDLPNSGTYNVTVWYVPGSNRATNATFTVHHAGGSTPISVNQQNNGETWFNLGTYSFNAGTSGSVSLDNVAGPSVVIADAVRFTSTTPTLVDLTMWANPPAWGETSPPIGSVYAYYEGEYAPISATPAPGYTFSHWTVSIGENATDPFSPNTTVLHGHRRRLVTAIFVEDLPATPQFRAFWADAFHVGFKSTRRRSTTWSPAPSRATTTRSCPRCSPTRTRAATATVRTGTRRSCPKASDISRQHRPARVPGPAGPRRYGIEVHPWLVAFRDLHAPGRPRGNATLAAAPRVHDGALNSDIGRRPGGPFTATTRSIPVRPTCRNTSSRSFASSWVATRSTVCTGTTFATPTASAGYPSDNGLYVNSGLAPLPAHSPATPASPSTSLRPVGGLSPPHASRSFVRRAQVELTPSRTTRPQTLRQTAALVTWGDAPSELRAARVRTGALPELAAVDGGGLSRCRHPDDVLRR